MAVANMQSNKIQVFGGSLTKYYIRVGLTMGDCYVRQKYQTLLMVRPLTVIMNMGI